MLGNTRSISMTESTCATGPFASRANGSPDRSCRIIGIAIVLACQILVADIGMAAKPNVLMIVVDDMLRRAAVEVLHIDGARAFVRGTLEPGDQIVDGCFVIVF